METIGKTNNQRLLELVRDSGLPLPVAMTIFNRGLGTTGCTESAWKRYLANPQAELDQQVSDAWLAHATEQFGRL